MRTRVLCSLTVLGICVTCGLSGCSRSPEGRADESGKKETGIVTVYVVNYPLAYFAERIGQRYVHVVFPAPSDEDPAFWMPDAQTIVNYQNADLILLNGASYAKWIRTVSLPASKLVDTSASFGDQLIEIDDITTHTHGPGNTHSHARTAFTTWLDAKLAVSQAEAIFAALVKLRSQHKETFQRNFAALERDLNALDAKLVEVVGGETDRPLIFSHPVYQYFVHRYNLDARSVHWEPGEVPSTQMWEEFQKLLEDHPAKWMVWAGDPVEETVKRLRQLGVESIIFDPCSHLPDNGDYVHVMQQNIDNFASVFATDG